MTCAQAKEFSIHEYLERMGYKPVHLYASGHFYYSILAHGGESTPSFEVSRDGRAFHDWSTGASGNIIDLAMGVVGTHSVSSALEHIASILGTQKCKTQQFNFSFHQHNCATKILSIKPIHSIALFDYGKRRGIMPELLSSYCSEVNYMVEGKIFFAIGWQNNSGGWELRNPYAKMCLIKKDLTYINNLHSSIAVFEGFFDYLSAVTLGWIDQSRSDILVLNSTAMISRALPILENALHVYCYLDNDKSGCNATNLIKSACSNAIDYSFMYAGYDDLNEYLINK